MWMRRGTPRCTTARWPTPRGSGPSTGKRLDWIKPYTRSRTPASPTATCHIRWFEDGTLNVAGELHRPPPARPRRPDRDHLGAGRPERRAAAHHLRRAARAGLPDRQRAQGDGRRPRRPGGDLPADDPRGGLRHAGLRPDRRDPLGGVRGLLARRAGQPDQRLRRQGGHHRRRRPARRPGDQLKDNVNQALLHWRSTRRGARRAAHRPADRLGRGPRPLVARDGRRGLARLPGRGDGRRGPAVHPLHLRLDRQAQGRGAHLGRLPRLCRDDPPVRLRLPRRRRLLVHRGRGLGDRPQLHRLRAARQRRDHADVRGRADLSRRRPLLGGLRQAQASTSSTPRRPRSGR